MNRDPVMIKATKEAKQKEKELDKELEQARCQLERRFHQEAKLVAYVISPLMMTDIGFFPLSSLVGLKANLHQTAGPAGHWKTNRTI